jgi:hypothetical protein
MESVFAPAISTEEIWTNPAFEKKDPATPARMKMKKIKKSTTKSLVRFRLA